MGGGYGLGKIFWPTIPLSSPGIGGDTDMVSNLLSAEYGTVWYVIHLHLELVSIFLSYSAQHAFPVFLFLFLSSFLCFSFLWISSFYCVLFLVLIYPVFP